MVATTWGIVTRNDDDSFVAWTARLTNGVPRPGSDMGRWSAAPEDNGRGKGRDSEEPRYLFFGEGGGKLGAVGGSDRPGRGPAVG